MFAYKSKFIFKNFKEYIKFKKNHKTLSTDITKNYEYFLFYFYKFSNRFVQKHRLYFSKSKRGFGEDAFSSMWEYLFRTYRPKNILEIGVYRGQTLSLFQILSNLYLIDSKIYGITPLDFSGDSVSEYIDIDYLEDIKKNFNFFKLNDPNILKEYSTSKKSVDFINSINWDLIYIDGSHDYKVVIKDFENSFKNLNTNGLLIIDDSSLYLNYDSEFIKKKYGINTFIGHPGPSKVVLNIKNQNTLKHLFGVGHNNVFQKVNDYN